MIIPTWSHRLCHSYIKCFNVNLKKRIFRKIRKMVATKLKLLYRSVPEKLHYCHTMYPHQREKQMSVEHWICTHTHSKTRTTKHILFHTHNKKENVVRNNLFIDTRHCQGKVRVSYGGWPMCRSSGLYGVGVSQKRKWLRLKFECSMQCMMKNACFNFVFIFISPRYIFG